MNKWLDADNYKECQKIYYSVYACKPPKGAVVINKFEQVSAVRELGGQTFFTETDAILNSLIAEGRANITDECTPYIIMGTAGELWTVSEDTLMTRYTLEDGSPLMPSTLSIPSWVKVKTSPKSVKLWACFVPKDVTGTVTTTWGARLTINDPSVPHGKGDFVIAVDKDGSPDVTDIYVVNGLIFASTYDTKGWEDCISTERLASDSYVLPNLWS